MYSIETTFTFEAAHKLVLDYDSKCENLHGHSYICTVTINSPELNKNGMIMDFKSLKTIIYHRIEEPLDHKYLNSVFDSNPTAENMAKWICDTLNEELVKQYADIRCVKVELNETAKNKAIWRDDE